jgi:membrane protein YdbS with pleckstrin-like domain
VAISETRIVAGRYSRVPETVLLLLLVGSALSLGMVGYMAGLKRRRSILSAVVMVVALGVVLTIVIDLDRPTEGLIQVSQQALLAVQGWIGLPSS